MEMILRVTTPPEWDNVAFVENIANDRPVLFTGCNVGVVSDPVIGFRQEIGTAILKDGLSTVLCRQLLTEDVVAPGQKPDAVRDIMVRFLTELGVDSELIVVDPYFYATTRDAEYPQFVADILAPFSGVLREVRVITRPDKIDKSVQKGVDSAICAKCTSVNVSLGTSDEYHDRFWISASRTKGILVGTSLNGLGRKYAVVDRLKDADVENIVRSLVSSGLV